MLSGKPGHSEPILMAGHKPAAALTTITYKRKGPDDDIEEETKGEEKKAEEQRDEEEIGGDAPPEGGDAGPRPPVTRILGQEVKFVPGRKDSRWSYADRWALQCSNPAHTECGKSRSLELDVHRFGQRACEGFLGAWLQQSHLEQPARKAFKPSADQIRAYLDSH